MASFRVQRLIQTNFHEIRKQQSLFLEVLDDDIPFLEYLAFTSYEVGDFENAIAFFELISKHEIDYIVELTWGEICSLIGRDSDSREHYVNSLGICPGNIIPRYRLYQLYRKENNRKESLKIAKEILNMKVKKESVTTISIKNDVEQYIEACRRNETNAH